LQELQRYEFKFIKIIKLRTKYRRPLFSDTVLGSVLQFQTYLSYIK